MNNNHYRLVYDILNEELVTEISYISIIFSLIFYIGMFLIFFTKAKGHKFGRLFVFLFIGSGLGFMLYDGISQSFKDIKRNLQIIHKIKIKNYVIIEGKVASYKANDYYNRKGGEFILNGYKYESSYRGFNSDYNSKLNLKNGLKIKIASEKYPNSYSYSNIYKIWIEDLRYEECLKGKKDDTCFTLALENVKDKEKFNMFFQKSLNSNNALTLFHIGKLYEVGAYRDKNNTEALRFYKKSCDKGEKKACDAYELLLKE